MNCKNCGNPLKENQNFCSACGSKIEREAITPVQNEVQEQATATTQNYQTPTQNVPHKEPLGTASMVIGIISLILSFIINIFVFPLALIGLILGIVNKAKKGNKKISGIILNAIAMVLCILFIVLSVVLVGVFANYLNTDEGKNALNDLYTELDYSSSENFISGKYNCADVDGDQSKYLITLHLNEDKTFLYGPYGRMENNYAKGTYTYVDEKKTNPSGQYKYFMVTLKGNEGEFVSEGVVQDKAFDSQMEMGVTTRDGKREGVVLFVSSYNTYYCYSE